MLNIFKKKKVTQDIQKNPEFEIELIGTVLAYEIARSDGDISDSELSLLKEETKKIALEVNKTDEEILSIIETYSKNSVSFHEFIADINNDFSKEEKDVVESIMNLFKQYKLKIKTSYGNTYDFK